MKLSLAWIFDHIQGAHIKNIDMQNLIVQFSAKVAEIEDHYPVTFDMDAFTLAQVTHISHDSCTLYSSELKKEIVLNLRKDAVLHNYYLVKVARKQYSWATLIDLGSEKEALLAAIQVTDLDAKGSWKQQIEKDDYIWVIDNKAITNRPDMWSHRGFAREIAAVLNLKLVPEEQFLISKPIKHYVDIAPANANSPFALMIDQNPACAEICKRIAGTYIASIQYLQSKPNIALRFARVDSKPIDFIVDATNYVMLDIGQPMHAFDAAKIPSHKIVGRCAHDGEKIQLLDGETIELSSEDFIITDGSAPLALAGVMGGIASSVSKNTHSLYIESANFNAAAIRKTATRHKKRTESSTRFEKSLDPNQNTQALLRFLKLLETYDVSYEATDTIASLGPLAQEKIIEVTHQAIVSTLGVSISPDTVQKYLMQLGFGIEIKHVAEDSSKIIYKVMVPTYRSTKDVTIKQDIIEEIARFVGYANIPPVLPSRQMNPFDTTAIHRIRKIKQQLAFGSHMNEVQTYAFYDEEFLKQLAYEPADTLRLAQPFSLNIQQLVTSLVPNLFKCIATNVAKQDELRFFEFDRVWFNDVMPVESKELAGIFYHKKKAIDFYACKAELQSFFEALGIEVTWRKPTEAIGIWYAKHQTAELVYKNQIIGTAGIASSKFLHKVADGEAFVFEINGDFLLNIQPEQRVFKPLKKYQEVELDISLKVPLQVTIEQLERSINGAEKRIHAVRLVDFFEKPEWKDQKSITLRFVLYDNEKTLVKEEIDTIYDAVVAAVKRLGADIR